jgi:hypothetical protein
MSQKDQTPFFNNPPAWFYRVMAVSCLLIVAVTLYPLGLCLWGHQYRPVLILGPTIYFSIMLARNLWQRARMKDNEGFKRYTIPRA